MRPTNIDGDKKRLLIAIGLTAFLYAACGATLALYPSWGSGSAEPSRRPALRLTLSGDSRPGTTRPGASVSPASPSAESPSVHDYIVPEVPETPSVTVVQGDSGNDAVPGATVAEKNGSDDATADGPITAGGPLPGSGEDSFRAWLDESIRTGLSYPERARRRGVEGTVVLSLTVAGDGSSCVVSVTRGSGSTILDRNALSFVKSLFPAPIAPGKEFTSPVKIQYLFK